jgi:hypothetical protein
MGSVSRLRGLLASNRRDHVDDFTGSYPPNSIHQRREQWTVEFHSVPLDMHDYDPEVQFLEVVLILKPLVDGHQNVAPALGLRDQP